MNGKSIIKGFIMCNLSMKLCNNDTNKYSLIIYKNHTGVCQKNIFLVRLQ